MSPAEVLAPFVALPIAGMFIWLAVWDYISKKRRQQALKEWSRQPVSQSLLILSGLCMAVFFVWIGTYQLIGSGHAGWVAAILLIAGLASHRTTRPQSNGETDG